MRFELTEEQRGFADVLDDLLGAAQTPALIRDWSAGKPDDGLKVWQQLAELGLTGLLIAEDLGGLAADEVDLTVAFEALGRHALPGPWVESAVFLPVLLGNSDCPDLLRDLCTGKVIATSSVTGFAPYALDADVASQVFAFDGRTLSTASAQTHLESVDPARRLFQVSLGDQVAAVSSSQAQRAVDRAVLATAAQLLGLGENLLAQAVEYAKTRKQFGRMIGSYQALKHALADVRIGLDFARPLLHTAALSLRSGSSDAHRDVSAAKVVAARASYRAARTALQVHGAIGYTAEHDLGLWILKVRALQNAWGTSRSHRDQVLHALA